MSWSYPLSNNINAHSSVRTELHRQRLLNFRSSRKKPENLFFVETVNSRSREISVWAEKEQIWRIRKVASGFGVEGGGENILEENYDH